MEVQSSRKPCQGAAGCFRLPWAQRGPSPNGGGCRAPDASPSHPALLRLQHAESGLDKRGPLPPAPAGSERGSVPPESSSSAGNTSCLETGVRDAASKQQLGNLDTR